MGRSLASKNGNDKIYTPDSVALNIVKHFNPQGRLLEPCRGRGAFTKAMPIADWFEIDDGKDFFTAEGHWDWIITNPPYSIYRQFMNKCFDVADNVVFLQLINATFYKARLSDLKDKGFGIQEIVCTDTPREFPQFGFQMGCVHYKRGYLGDIKFSKLV